MIRRLWEKIVRKEALHPSAEKGVENSPTVGAAEPQETRREFSCPHDHHFLSDRHDANERRTWWVILLTVTTMILEIVTGILFGSMALLADGWHMGSHASAMGMAALAYYLARKQDRKSVV